MVEELSLCCSKEGWCEAQGFCLRYNVRAVRLHKPPWTRLHIRIMVMLPADKGMSGLSGFGRECDICIGGHGLAVTEGMNWCTIFLLLHTINHFFVI